MANPAFQFYPKQWLGDDKVLLMDWDARAMHLHLICIAWQQQPACTLPDDDEALRRWCGSPLDWESRLRDQILSAWTRRRGRLVQLGLEREYLKQQELSQKRSKAAQARWGKNKDRKQVHRDASGVHDANGMQNDALLSSSSSADIPPCSPPSGGSESGSLKKGKPKAKRFTAPTVEEVADHVREKGYTFTAEAFMAHYQAVGWVVGKNKPMRDWKAACVTWQQRRNEEAQAEAPKPPTSRSALLAHIRDGTRSEGHDGVTRLTGFHCSWPDFRDAVEAGKVKLPPDLAAAEKVWRDWLAEKVIP